MKKRYWVIIIGAFFLLVIFLVYLLVNAQLGPPLEVTPPVEQPGETSEPPTSLPPTNVAATSVPTITMEIPPTPIETMEATQSSGACGETGAVTLLLLGENLPDTPNRGVDAIRLMRVDFESLIVTQLSLPPDLWVITPSLAVKNIDATTLTQAYYEAIPLKEGDERAKMAFATNLFAQTLADNFGVVPDHYITLKQSVFEDVLDVLGGLSINLPRDVDGSSQGFGYFTAGQQVLNGQQVLDYVRIINAPGDQEPGKWQSLERQNQVLDALMMQLTRPETLLKLPDLTRQFYRAVVTDMSINQFLALNCMLGRDDLVIEKLEFDQDLVFMQSDVQLIPKNPDLGDYLKSLFMP